MKCEDEGNTQQSHMEFWNGCENGGDRYGSMNLLVVGNALPYIYTSSKTHAWEFLKKYVKFKAYNYKKLTLEEGNYHYFTITD